MSKPNLIWCDETVEPPEFYREGREKIEISPAEQKAGFYHEDPHKLRTLSGGKLQIISACGCGGESDLPADLPARKVFAELGMKLAEVKALENNELLALKGIGVGFAEQVLNYFAEGEEK